MAHPRNPWLDVPGEEYEAHMGSPGVQQLEYLARIFAEVLTSYRPEALAVPGCATGNGFEHIPAGASRVVGVDFNPQYLATLRQRFQSALPTLELVCEDVVSCDLGQRSLDLVHAALIFEYVNPATIINRVEPWLRPGGTLSVVLQLPTSTGRAVSDTPYESIAALEAVLTLVEPSVVRALAGRCGLDEIESRTDTLASGKQFFFGCFQKRPRGGA